MMVFKKKISDMTVVRIPVQLLLNVEGSNMRNGSAFIVSIIGCTFITKSNRLTVEQK